MQGQPGYDGTSTAEVYGPRSVVPSFLRRRGVKERDARYVIGVSSLLIGIFAFTGANSLLTTQVVLTARELNFPPAAIGGLTSLYFVGFILGCLYGGKLVSRVGHIRSFAGLAAIAMMVALIHPMAPILVVWLGLRAISGFSHAVLQMTAESWINSVTTPEHRSTTLSIYRIVDLSSVTLAQFGLMLPDESGFLLFSLIAVSISFALLPVVFSRTTGPAPISQTKPDLKLLMAMAPMAGASALIFGFATAGFWGLAPIYLAGNGYGGNIVAIFVSLGVVGGALSQFPIGKLSDRIDRRLVIMGAAGVAIVAGIGLTLFGGQPPLMLISAGLFGAAAMPIYALAISHANDSAGPDDFVGLAGALLLCFGIGAVAGPAGLSVFIAIFGDGMLFVGIGIAFAVLIAFGAWRLSARAQRSQEEKDTFVHVPAGSPEQFQIDPRYEEAAAS